MSKLIQTFSQKFELDPETMVRVLKKTAFRKAGAGITDEQLIALLLVANEYGLNPLTKEIHAYPDQGGIVPVVGVDGWIRIINQHPQLDGIEFAYAQETKTIQGAQEAPIWMECSIWRKDRTKPIIVREILTEVFRATQPWKGMTNRMFRHKTLIQCSRVAFGFAGIYDEDEAKDILDNSQNVVDTVIEAPAETVKLEFYPSEKYEVNSLAWADLILKGERTPEQIEAVLAAKGFQLTPEQIEDLKGFKNEDPESPAEVAGMASLPEPTER